MPESGSVSPEGAGLNENPSAAHTWASEDAFPDAAGGGPKEAEGAKVAPTAPEKGKARSQRGPARTNDPVVQWLTLGIFFVIIFWLVAVLSAMMFGLLSPAQAPRTSAERDLLALTGTVQSGKADSKIYAQYIAVLINSGQLSKAQQALEQALKTAKADKSYLYGQQAALLLGQKDYPGAVAAADKTMAEAKAELKAFQDENVKKNRKPNAGAVMPTSYADAALIKAQALLATKDFAGAVKAFDVSLAEQPTDSDVLVQRGLAKLQVGDKKGAEADFRTALKFIPDYQPALDGLKQIGAAQ